MLCEGRYILKLAGFVHTIIRKETANIKISASNETVLNRALSITEGDNDYPPVK
jgi:hypothetical protein